MKDRIIPIDSSIIIDGIAGIYPGNTYKVDYLRDLYSNSNIFFRISNVAHSINSTDWTTTLTGGMVIGNIDE